MLRTNCSALKWLQTLEGQQARWLEQFQEHQFEVVHRAASKHTNADDMSRTPLCKQCRCDDCNSMNHLSVEDTQTSALLSITTLANTQDNSLTPQPKAKAPSTLESKGICIAWLNDDTVEPILRKIEANKWPDKSKVGHEAHQLYQQWQLLVQEG